MSEVSAPVIAVGLVLSAGVHPVRVHHGDHRPVLPAVRPDDRLVDGDLDVQLADALSPALAAMLLRAAQQGALRSPALAGVSDPRGVGRLHVPGARVARAWSRQAQLAAGVSRRSPTDWSTWREAWAGSSPGRAAIWHRGHWLGAIGLLWCLSKPINWICGVRVSSLFNRGFAGHRLTATPGFVGGMLRVFVLVLLALRRPAGADVLGLPEHAARVSSRRRTWATCWSTPACPTRPRSSARRT